MIREELFLAAIVASSRDAIIGKDLDGRILSWSPGAERLYGYTAEEMRGRSIRVLVPEDRQDEVSHILATIARGEPIADHEAVRVTKDGRQIAVLLSVSPVRDPGGEIIGAATIARDITEQRRLQRELERMAHHDDLTGLANRRRFIEELEAHVERASRYGWKGAVVALDVDALKAVNDAWATGPATSCSRRPPRASARRSGAATSGAPERRRVRRDPARGRRTRRRGGGAHKLIAALEANETRIAGIRAGTASAGVAPLEDGITADELMIRADVALYQAKRRGGNRFVVYDSTSAHTIPGGTAASAGGPD